MVWWDWAESGHSLRFTPTSHSRTNRTFAVAPIADAAFVRSRGEGFFGGAENFTIAAVQMGQLRQT